MLLTKTTIGQAAFKERSPLFSAKQRTCFILFDGIKSVEQILQTTTVMGFTQSDVDYLVEQGLLAENDLTIAVSPEQGGGLLLTEQERYSQAKPMATQLTASLGLRGFMLNLSVESADGYAGLLALLPKIQDAVGKSACAELERLLKG